MTSRTTIGRVAAVLFAAACSDGGSVGSNPQNTSELPGDSSGDADDMLPGSSPTGAPSESPLEGGDPNTAITRLSHAQYANTLRDLFGVEETPADTFAPDALNGFSFETSNDLRVDSRLGPQYRAAAEEMARRALNDADVFARVVPCDAGEPGCAGEFIESFGERAFRRPLSGAEAQRFQALFDLGGELGDSGDAFRDGVGLVIEAMLQSPQFLYRTEVSGGTPVNGRVPLDDWEIASRLSYFIFDSMPDEELFERARQGELRTPRDVGAQVARMLDSERASRKLVSFHEQVWQFGRYSKIAPDPSFYPDVPSNFIERLRDASARFIDSVIAEGGGLREFLTAPYAFADAELAPIYGQDVDSDMARIEFFDGERKGFLMQAGWLASNAYSVKTDPIHRGLFILRDILCRNIPDPPPGAQMTPLPETDEPIETTREEISLLTGQLYCPQCHSQINEPGFAFEGFDALGQVREQENGVDVDTTGSITLDGERIEFAGASELVDALAESQEARDCYASRWLEFAYGRVLGEPDEAFRQELAAEALSVHEIISSVATSEQFMTRAASEVSQ